ncbi:MAG: putative phage infection (PIP) family protein YhgE [Bacteroidia bacterium]|jgi:uncharacterized phage infection (PIP) family protein YhgE
MAENLKNGWTKRLENKFEERFKAMKDEAFRFHTKMFGGEEALEHKLTKIEQTVEQRASDIQRFHDKSEEFYNQLLDSDGEGTSIQEELDEIVEEVKETKEAADTVMEKIEAFDLFIHGEYDEEGETIQAGFKEQLLKLKKDQKDQIEAWEKKYDATLDRIEILLSGATTVSLAKAYETHKKSFTIPSVLWSLVFFACMGSMVGIGFNAIGSTSLEINQILLKILVRLPLFVPLVWLAIYSSKQQSQNKRLVQEYAYKESFARSFEGFKKQVEKLGINPESMALEAKLLDAILEMSKENPSSTLDSTSHKDGPPGFKDVVEAARAVISKSSS